MPDFNNILTEATVTSLYEEKSDFDLLITPFVTMYEFEGLSKTLNAFTLNNALRRSSNDVGFYALNELTLDIADVNTRINEIIKIKFGNDFNAYMESVKENFIDPYVINTRSMDRKTHDDIIAIIGTLLSHTFSNITKGVESRAIVTDEIERNISEMIEKSLSITDRNRERSSITENMNLKLADLTVDQRDRYFNPRDMIIEIQSTMSQLNSIASYIGDIAVSTMQSIQVVDNTLMIRAYHISPSRLQYYGMNETLVELYTVKDVNDFIKLAKYILRVIGAFESIRRSVINILYDYVSRLIYSETTISDAFIDPRPSDVSIKFTDLILQNVFSYRVDEVDAHGQVVQESIEFLKNYDPKELIAGNVSVLQEAIQESSLIKKSLDDMKKKVRAFKKQFLETSDNLVSENKEWVESIKDFNTTRIDGTKFEYKMYPYWKTIEDMVNYKIPEFDEAEAELYLSPAKFREKYFSDILDGDGKPVYQEKFRGGLKEEIRQTKINATYNKCLKIIRRYPSYANKISGDINSLLNNLNKASRMVMTESITYESLLECNVFDDRFFQVILEAPTPKLVNEDKSKPPLEIDKLAALTAWFRESYKIVAAKMTVLEEAYDASIKYIQYLQKASTVEDRSRDADKK